MKLAPFDQPNNKHVPLTTLTNIALMVFVSLLLVVSSSFFMVSASAVTVIPNVLTKMNLDYSAGYQIVALNTKPLKIQSSWVVPTGTCNFEQNMGYQVLILTGTHIDGPELVIFCPSLGGPRVIPCSTGIRALVMERFLSVTQFSPATR